MKTGMKASLIIITLTLVACLIVLRPRPDEPVAANVSDTSRGPSFEVHVMKPRIARPFFGILPTKLKAKIFGGGDLRFDQASPGAKFGSVGHNRLELTAVGWDLFIETDSEGRVTSGTRLVFEMELAERQRRLLCRPADRAYGYLDTTTRAGSDELDGHFLVQLATCADTETGRVIEWPPAPLTVRGSFENLPHGLNRDRGVNSPLD
jgi:hypothetical protein